MTIISVYAPTMSYSLKKVEEFYSLLEDTIRSVPTQDKLIVPILTHELEEMLQLGRKSLAIMGQLP